MRGAPSAAGSSAALPQRLPPNAAKAALDAAFVGNLKESSRRYAELAEANPGDASYDLAARLAAEEAVRR